MTHPESRIGEYRLWRQADGRGYFAEARVEAVPGEDGPARTQWSVDPTDTGSAQPAEYPAEMVAAVAGVTAMLAALPAVGVPTDGTTVHIRHLGLTAADSEESAVRAAAAAATAAAFGAAGQVEVVFDGGWQCRLPAGADRDDTRGRPTGQTIRANVHGQQ
jgi:hypothetical protein